MLPEMFSLLCRRCVSTNRSAAAAAAAAAVAVAACSSSSSAPRSRRRRRRRGWTWTASPLLAALVLLAASSPSPLVSHTKGGSDGPSSLRRVRVQVFIEALCIDSKRFVLHELVPAYELLTNQVVNLDVVVFGNARISEDDDDDEKPHLMARSVLRSGSPRRKVTCQHGPAECDANSYEQCAMYASKRHHQDQEQQMGLVRDRVLLPALHDDGGDVDVDVDPAKESLAYVACLFTDLDMGYRDDPFGPQVFASCARSSFEDAAGIGFRIRACHDDPALSAKLQQQAAVATPKDHTHVPWILINGEHTYDPFDGANDDDYSHGPSYTKLVKAICRAYEEGSSGGRASPLPPACT